MAIDKLLEKLRACEEVRKWAEGKSWPEIYSTCERADWLLWLFVRVNPDSVRERVLAAGRCAETVKHLMTDNRSIRAVEAAIAFGLGEISRGDLSAWAAAAEEATSAAAAEAAAAAEPARAAAAEAAAECASSRVRTSRTALGSSLPGAMHGASRSRHVVTSAVTSASVTERVGLSHGIAAKEPAISRHRFVRVVRSKPNASSWLISRIT